MTIQQVNRPMNAREWGMLLLLALLWGCSFFFAAVALRELPTLTIVVLRVALAAATLYVILAILRQRTPTGGRAWWSFFQMAIVNNVIPFSLLVWGQTRIASGVASILIATTPFFASVLAHFATNDEKLTVNRAIGVAFGVIGVAILLGGSATMTLSGDFLGELAVIGAAIAYACSSVFARRFSTMGIDPLASATGLMTVSTIILLPVALIVEQPWTLALPSMGIVLAVIGFALPSTAFAYLLYFRIVATAGATNLMLVTFLMPVTAILLGVLLLGERLEPRHVAGMALIALGLAAIDGRAWRMMRRAIASN
jgi:drug/metabolite transporter (DMT)-like permease